MFSSWLRLLAHTRTDSVLQFGIVLEAVDRNAKHSLFLAFDGDFLSGVLVFLTFSRLALVFLAITPLSPRFWALRVIAV
jgi:hypothetical protein